jgi:hypothetical protein
MDITTVKGRHLHQGRVVVRDAGHPTAQTELGSGSCVSVPTGGSPWLTVATGRADTRNGRPAPALAVGVQLGVRGATRYIRTRLTSSG